MSFTNAAGQVSEGYIDLLVRTSAGKFVIIDHKVVGGPDVLVHVRHYAGQQDIYRRAVGGDGFADVSVYLHLPHQGNSLRCGGRRRRGLQRRHTCRMFWKVAKS